MRKIQMDCLPGLSGRLAHLQSSNILITKMKSLLAELNMRYFNSANGLIYLYSTGFSNCNGLYSLYSFREVTLIEINFNQF